MRKIVALLVLWVTTAVAACAARDVRLKSGDINVLKEKVAVECVIDVEGATWEDDEPFKEHCGEDYDLRIKLLNESWPKYFAQYSKGPVVSGDAPKYKVVFKITKFEKSIGKSSWGKIGVEFYGEISFVDLSTGLPVLVVTIDGEEGKYDYVENDRYPKAMESVCKSMFKLL